MYKVIAFFVCLGIVSADVVLVDSCGGEVAVPEEVRINGCEALPCSFSRGETAIVEIDISLDEDVETLPLWAFASIGQIIQNVSVLLPVSDCCEILYNDQECPLNAGTIANIRLEHIVEADNPGLLTVDLVLGIENGRNETISCFGAEIIILSDE